MLGKKDKLKTEQKQLAHSIVQLRIKLEGLQNLIKTGLKEKKELMTLLSGLKIDALQYADKTTELKDRYKMNLKENDDMKKAFIVSSGLKQKEAETELATLSAGIIRLTIDKDKLHTKYEKLETNKNVLLNKKKKLKRQVQELDKQKTDLSADIAAVKDNLKVSIENELNAENKLMELTEAHNNLQTTFDDLKAGCTEQSKEVAENEKKTAALSETRNIIKKDINDLEQEREELLPEIEKLRLEKLYLVKKEEMLANKEKEIKLLYHKAGIKL